MALKMNYGTPFFAGVFGQDHPVAQKAKLLAAAGVTFDVALYSVTATFNGTNKTVLLSMATTNLLKGVASASVEHNHKLLEDFVMDLEKAPASVPASSETLWLWPHLSQHMPNLIVLIKAIRTVTGLGLAEAKKIADHVVVGKEPQAITLLDSVSVVSAINILKATSVAVSNVHPGTGLTVPSVPPVPTVATPTNAVISLKDAVALGQKVHGTNSGSVYHTIALTDRVKVAARLYKGGGVSIRAEWLDNASDEVKKLKDAGMDLKSGHGSMHFPAEQVPMPRIIGAFLMDTGIKWKALVSGSELVFTEHP